MSRTLFIYVFKDLIRIFVLALLALAVIMSFGGLLRPLTRQGLDIGQVGQVLAYLLPAMTTYALPIAALFATTMVYGRLSSDNEITACRAGGISYFSMVTPALLLGLVVSILSLLLLCFVVPGLTLQVEKVATSNFAKYVAFQIDRNHQLQVTPSTTLFAQDAYLPPPDPVHPETQSVVLIGPMIVTKGVVAPPQPGARKAPASAPVTALPPGTRVPEQFWMTRQATAFLRSRPDGQIEFSARAEGGTMFERNHLGNRGGIGTAEFGPDLFSPPLKEKPKFMDIRQLKSLLADRSQSATLRNALANTITKEQEAIYRQQLLDALTRSTTLTLNTPEGDRYTVTRPKATVPDAPRGRGEIVLASPDPTKPAVRVDFYKNGRLDTSAVARLVRIRAEALTDQKQMLVSLRMEDADVTAGDSRTTHARYDRKLASPMPDDVDAASKKTPESFLAGTGVAMNAPPALRKTIAEVTNDIYSEMHSRVSFSISCCILVAVGAALGLMLRSGNLLSAFAVSVVPALLCIALVATGTHVIEAVPDVITPKNNPLNLGIAVIWSGNLLVLVIAATLLTRLQRQ